MKRFFSFLACALVLSLQASVSAHETDQYTSAPGREYADLGDHMTAWVYDTLDRAVNRLNADMEADLRRGVSEAQVLKEYDAQVIASAVFHTFPNAYDVIEGLETRVHSKAWKNRYPGMVVGHKAVVGHVYQFAHLPVDIRQFFKLWFASTIKVHGVYLGTDKVGHFTDMGHNYYRAYIVAIKAGKSEAEAHRAAVKLGTDHPLYSESGLLGNVSAGAYSNADLVSNYAGFLFYKNLLHPVNLKGQSRPALLEREGVRLRLAPHVARSSDFLSWFISDHFDEALNPSLFSWTMRGGIRSAIRTRAPQILWRYRDAHGQQRTPEYFRGLQESLATYYGEDYGHKGAADELILLSDTCFEPVPSTADTVERNTTGHNALHWAAISGDLETVRKLLDRGFDAGAAVRPPPPWASSESGKTALHLAVAGGHEAIVRLLLERGAGAATPSRQGVTPLHLAGRWPDIAALLVQRGAPVNAADHAGRTPLHWAAMDAGSQVSPLLQAQANPDQPDHAGLTPLHLAAAAGSAESVSRLLHAGASVGTQDNMGTTPLHAAAGSGHVSVVNELLDAGASASATDAFGLTPSHSAAAQGHTAALLLLIQRGADANVADSYGTTPLHLACRYGRRETVAMLIAQDADVKQPNRVGITPLHEAAYSGDRAVYRMLVLEGGDELARNRANRTPRQIAQDSEAQFPAIGNYRGGGNPAIHRAAQGATTRKPGG